MEISVTSLLTTNERDHVEQITKAETIRVKAAQTERADNLAGLTRYKRVRSLEGYTAPNSLIHDCVGPRKAIKPGKYLV